MCWTTVAVLLSLKSMLSVPVSHPPVPPPLVFAFCFFLLLFFFSFPAFSSASHSVFLTFSLYVKPPSLFFIFSDMFLVSYLIVLILLNVFDGWCVCFVLGSLLIHTPTPIVVSCFLLLSLSLSSLLLFFFFSLALLVLLL